VKENYPVYIKWSEATDWILGTLETFPKSVRFSIAGRIADLTLDVMEGIIEAIYIKDRRSILDGVNLNLEKLRIMFGICHRRRYLSVRQYEFASRLIDETGRMIGGWRKPL
jgi:hypothetical protein